MKAPALLRLHFIVFLWGFTAIIGKLIHAEAPILAFYRMLFASIFLYVFIRFVKKESLHVSKKLFFQLIGIGGMMAIHWLCFFHAIKVSNVAIALSCLSTATIFASVMEPLVFKRRMDVSEVVIGIIILACISLIFNIEFQYKTGIFYGVLAALFGTFFSVFNGRLYGKTTSGNIIFYEIFGGWALLACFYVLSGQIFTINEINYTDLALITVLAGVFTAFPMLESVSLMKYISPFTLILAVNLEPVYGIILAFFIFGESEKMTPVFYIASGVMITAIVVNGILKAQKTKKAKNIPLE